MADLLGSLTLPLLVASVLIAALTYLTHRILGDYLHKWFEMKPIPELEETYPLIGNALLFKPNAGGEEHAVVAERREAPGPALKGLI